MEILKIMREKYGLKQKDFAKKIDIQPTTYNQYETGVREPNIQQLTKIANFYNCSIDYLVGREKIEQEKKQPEQVELEVKVYQTEAHKECIDLINQLSESQALKLSGYIEKMLEDGISNKNKILN